MVLDLSIAHDRFGSSSHVQQNGCLSHPQDLDAPLRIAAQRRCLSHCKECGGEGICQHQRQRSKCKECGGARICRFFARTLLNPKSLFAQEGRRIYRRSRRIYWRRSLPRSPLPRSHLPRSPLPRSPSRLYLWQMKKKRQESQVFIPAVGDTVPSSSMMVLFSCSEIRRSESMNVKIGREGQRK